MISLKQSIEAVQLFDFSTPDFLRTWFADVPAGSGAILFVERRVNADGKLFFEAVKGFDTTDIEGAVKFVEGFKGSDALYFKTSAFNKEKLEKRISEKKGAVVGNKHEVDTVVGIAMDVDAGKRDSYATQADVWAAIHNMPALPTMVTLSGKDDHGFHVYWKLSKPIRIISVDEVEKLNQRIRAWRGLLVDQVARVLTERDVTDFKREKLVDRTFSVDRVLRPVGAVRSSGDVVRLAVYAPERRYTLDELTAPGWTPIETRDKVPDTGTHHADGIISAYFASRAEQGDEITIDSLLTENGYLESGSEEWVRKDSETKSRSIVLGRVINGLPGVNVFSGGCAPLKCDDDKNDVGRRYSLHALWVAFNFGDVDEQESWKRAAAFCYSKLPARSLTNYQSSGKTKFSRPLPDIIADFKSMFPLRKVMGTLIDDEYNAIDRPPKLFAWIQQRTQVFWADSGEGKVSKSEFFEAVTREAEDFDSIQDAPHFPPIRRVLYRNTFEVGEVADLIAFADQFSPATPVDRILILAAIVTPFWGGPGGQRPFFVVSSGGRRGGGKTTLMEYISRLANAGEPGMHSIGCREEWDGLKRRLINSRDFDPRVVCLDNFKGHAITGSTLESLVTSRTVNDWQLYTGSAVKPNHYVYSATGNYVQQSEDMASRTVEIKLKPAEFNTVWAESMERTDWRRVISGIAAFFQLPRVEVDSPNRFALWCADVLGRLDNPDDVIREIRCRAESLSSETDDALEIRSVITQTLNNFKVSKQNVFISSARLSRLFEGSRVAGRRDWSAKGASQYVSRHLDSKHLLELSPRRTNTENGFLWQAGEDETIVNLDNAPWPTDSQASGES